MMMFAEDYLDFDYEEAEAEVASGLPQLCECGKLLQDCDSDHPVAIAVPTDEDIDEQLRQLRIEDGDEDTEDPDTQYSDYGQEDED